ncbi:MAG: hypothetical protein ACK5JS_07975 [Mangrovibacterium sp.]
MKISNEKSKSFSVEIILFVLTDTKTKIDKLFFSSKRAVLAAESNGLRSNGALRKSERHHFGSNQ